MHHPIRHQKSLIVNFVGSYCNWMFVELLKITKVGRYLRNTLITFRMSDILYKAIHEVTWNSHWVLKFDESLKTWITIVNTFKCNKTVTLKFLEISVYNIKLIFKFVLILEKIAFSFLDRITVDNLLLEVISVPK